MAWPKMSRRTIKAMDQLYEQVGRDMEKLTDGRKVLEPTSIDKISPAERFGLDTPQMRSVMDGLYAQAELDRYYVTPLMRRLGITKHPAICGHDRKKFADYAMKWVCMDCGTDL